MGKRNKAKINTKIKVLSIIIYLVIFGVLIWQGTKLVMTYMESRRSTGSIDSIVVNVQGNINNPGKYRVPLGTTHFEILQVAGVRTSSDLTSFNLTAQVDPEGEITVGELETPVAVEASVRLEFFLGEVSVISTEGIDRLSQEGMSIDESDRILTEENSQAELSISTFSRIDMDDFSEVSFDKIAIDSSTGKSSVELFQKIGICWYKIAYTDKFEQFTTINPLSNIAVSGKGADFTVEVKYSETVINVIDGLLLIERSDGSDAMNLITGQSVTIFNDGRPYNVTKLSGSSGITGRFNRLAKTKADILMQHMPLNILFCAPPSVFYLINIQFVSNKVNIVQLPSKTSVELYVHGFSTLQEALLYGGAVLTSTLVERIMNTRITKYMVFEKNDIIQTASAIGGVKVIMDDKASSFLRKKKGLQVLKGQTLVNFLLPALSGHEDSEKRQIAVMKSIFEQLQSKNIIITSLLAKQILSHIESNITTSETMQHYNNFISKKKWALKTHSLPVRQVRENNKVIYNPILEKSRTLLSK